MYGHNDELTRGNLDFLTKMVQATLSTLTRGLTPEQAAQQLLPRFQRYLEESNRLAVELNRKWEPEHRPWDAPMEAAWDYMRPVLLETRIYRHKDGSIRLHASCIEPTSKKVVSAHSLITPHVLVNGMEEGKAIDLETSRMEHDIRRMTGRDVIRATPITVDVPEEDDA